MGLERLKRKDNTIKHLETCGKTSLPCCQYCSASFWGLLLLSLIVVVVRMISTWWIWSRSLPTVIVASGAHNQPWWNFNGIFVGAVVVHWNIWGELTHKNDSWNEPPSRMCSKRTSAESQFDFRWTPWGPGHRCGVLPPLRSRETKNPPADGLMILMLNLWSTTMHQSFAGYDWIVVFSSQKIYRMSFYLCRNACGWSLEIIAKAFPELSIPRLVTSCLYCGAFVRRRAKVMIKLDIRKLWNSGNLECVGSTKSWNPGSKRWDNRTCKSCGENSITKPLTNFTVQKPAIHGDFGDGLWHCLVVHPTNRKWVSSPQIFQWTTCPHKNPIEIPPGWSGPHKNDNRGM